MTLRSPLSLVASLLSTIHREFTDQEAILQLYADAHSGVVRTDDEYSALFEWRPRKTAKFLAPYREAGAVTLTIDTIKGRRQRLTIGLYDNEASSATAPTGGSAGATPKIKKELRFPHDHPSYVLAKRFYDDLHAVATSEKVDVILPKTVNLQDDAERLHNLMASNGLAGESGIQKLTDIFQWAHRQRDPNGARFWITKTLTVKHFVRNYRSIVNQIPSTGGKVSGPGATGGNNPSFRGIRALFDDNDGEIIDVTPHPSSPVN